MGSYDTPIPLSEIESVLGWVDGFKLSRPTKKINRDFSDAVLLAEILAVHYPKLVEMHNYPPRNSHSLKLNNWMTLNRKVLKKLKLNLCCNTMEQLANCAPKVIERVLVMVRDKIRRDIDAKTKDDEPNLSSGGSYYEALGDDEHVLVVPVKTRVNGVLETHQQKVVSYESYLALKEELKDAKDSVEMLKQKVEHVDNLLKLKEERIEELHKQLERKQSRRKEAEILSNSLCVPFDTVPNPAPITIDNPQQLIKENSHIRMSEEQIALEKKSSEVLVSVGRRTPSLKSVSSKTSVYSRNTVESKHSFTDSTITKDSAKDSVINTAITKDSAKDSVINTAITKDSAKDSYTVVHIDLEDNLERIKSDVFEDIVDNEDPNYPPDAIEFKNIVQDPLTTIEDSIQREIKGIIHPLEYNVQKANYQ